MWNLSSLTRDQTHSPEVLTTEQPGKSLEHIYFRKLAIVYSFSALLRWKSSCYCSVAKMLCSTLCDPIDCSMPGFPVLQHLPEFSQTHVHWVSDAIQPFHPLLPTSPLALHLSQHQGLFQCSLQYFILISPFIYHYPAQSSCEKSELYPFYTHNFENSSEIQILSR